MSNSTAPDLRPPADRDSTSGPDQSRPARQRQRVRETPDPAKPWLRQPGESQKAYAAFQAYCDLKEERSLRKVANITGRRSLSTLGDWCRNFEWVKRSGALMDWRAEQRRAEQQRIEQAADAKRAAFRRDLLKRKKAMSLRWTEIAEARSKVPPLELRRVAERYEDGREKLVQIFHPPKGETIRFGKEGFNLTEQALREEENSASTQQRKEPDTFEDVPLEPKEKT